MCTAITYHTHDHYFGRNLDYEYAFPCMVTITPRRFPFRFRNGYTMDRHYAMIGMCMVEEDYPLYYDATNEFGLSIAGLNFPGNAAYLPNDSAKVNVAPFEWIPWLLGQCKDVEQAREQMENINIARIPFRQDFPLSPLHWIISDQTTCVTAEPTGNGLNIYENPIGVLTNNPPFDYHLHHLCDYMNLTAGEAQNRFASQVSLSAYSRGMGAIGLPGDLSSASRFVRAAFTKLNSQSGHSEENSITQFFHILDSVVQTDGCAQVGERYEKTLYSSCCNMDKGIYYYTTYENRLITGVDMHRVELNSNELYTYPISRDQTIRMEN